MNTIKVAGTGPIEQRVEALEQAVNYGEVVLPFTVVNDQDVGGGTVGPPGPQGPAGPQGIQGPAGPGVPPGGTTGQQLQKVSGTDYDTAWKDPPVTAGVTGTWNYRTADGTGDPGTRNLSPDVAAAPTFLRFSKTEVDLTDATNLLITTDVGDVILAQQRTDATHWSKAQVRAPIVDHGTWVEVPITVLANSGSGPPADNADVVVQFQRGAGTAGPTGPAGGDLDAPGSTYPNPVIGALKVTTGKVADAAITNVKLATGIDAAKITTGTIAQARLPVAPNGLLTANLNDAQVTDAKLAPTTVTAGTYGTAAKVAQITVNAQGRVSAVTELDIAPTGGSPSGPAGGDLGAPGSTYPNPIIADGVVTRAKLSTAAKKAYWG